MEVVAAAGADQHEEAVDHGFDGDLGLPGSHRLDDDDVEAGCFAEEQGLAGPTRDAAEGPAGGEGRTNASGRRVSSPILVLSPRIDPPVRLLEGSTASTATERPRSTMWSPSASMSVDLPAPGAPEIPTR